ncbi:MAG TPA: glycoside hydrolase family 3 N-terminal domain-containing protein [Brevefilum fermentans]|mgnify:CR=1 FL=1|nr:glycoside hydrolase family 3 N-terminal domain-containing protein [Brevefilum fermentans]
MTRLWRSFRCLMVLFYLLATPGVMFAHARETSKAEALLQTMSAEEKVSQIFLVTFEGNQVDEDSKIFQLLSKYQIGGVVLRADKNNFSEEETTASLRELTRSLQEIVWEASSQVVNIEDTGHTQGFTYVPLLIGVQQLGNGYPGDQILFGVEQLPSHLAIGASWDLSLANQVGEILGNQLSSLGINLYLGPNLDVLETVNNKAASSLGVNAFGGNPFWVGEMGKAFVSGLHTGSNNRMLVVAQNFPGTGNSDRSPDREVSTVRKSLGQLTQVELVPYFSVTTPSFGSPGCVDAMMISHNRYQGFQGNIRASTRPISFDSNAIQQVFSLPEFASWREAGGLLISDNLGSGAIRRFFDPNDVNFDARQVARNAFLAGNDVLYINNLISTGDPDPYTTLISTIDSFVQKYREDSAFARRVDVSVLRILEAKSKIYPNFAFPRMSNEVVEAHSAAQETTFDVAQAAVTLLSPSAQELDTLLPDPPLWYERMMIFTDVRTISCCDGCPSTTAIGTHALANALVNLYGPQAGGQILQNRINSYSFTQLTEFLDNLETDMAELIESNLKSADWLIFNTLNVSENIPSSAALRRILAERPELLSEKKVIVFALDSPIYLDATEISKVTAYYGLFSKAPAFLDVAARVLMQEYAPSGALPISLNAVGYDLSIVTAPNPNQVIRLELVMPVEAEQAPATSVEAEEDVGEPGVEGDIIFDITPTPAPTPLPSFKVGDLITIRTSPILDHNQNIVPDGTRVRFDFRISGEPDITQQFESTTQGGVAFFNYRIESAGGMDVIASSGLATRSETLQINISPEGVMSFFAFTPTPLVSPTPEPTPTATITPTLQPTPTSTPEPLPASYPSLGDWAFGVLVMGIGSALTFMIGLLWWGSSRWGLRSALCALIGGLGAYTYLNLGISGVKDWIQQSGTLYVIEIVVAGLLIGWIAALIWWMGTEGRYPKRNRR